jgi:arginyl-tRNA synthetase
VRSIYRKGGLDSVDAADISLDHPAERGLALVLARLPEAIETVAADCTPHVLCGYLFDLAGAFMGFYENCPVLKADSDAQRASRLALCDLTARTISGGLGLLGIETLEQM